MPLHQVINLSALRPIPSDEVLRRPAFWEDYYWESHERKGCQGSPLDSYPPLNEGPIIWSFPNRRHLILEIEDFDTSWCSLVLHDSPKKPTSTLGLDNVARRYPCALRWDELDLIGRYVASVDPDQPHPSWPVLFLYRFAVPTMTFPHEQALALVREAWMWSGVFPKNKLKPYLTFDGLNAGCEDRWREVKRKGWVLELGGLYPPYTLREEENKAFPFASLRGLLGDIRDAVG